MNAFFVGHRLKYQKLMDGGFDGAERIFNFRLDKEMYNTGVGPVKRVQPLLEERDHKMLFSLPAYISLSN